MKGSKGLTIVIKLGTSSIVHEKTHEPRLSTLSVIVETAVKLRRDGHRVVLVSSGAIGVALQMMDMEKRPKSLPQVQALAALGQCRLMSLWERFFMHLKQPVAQILLTRNDIADRTQYLNAQNTMNELLRMGIIPIVNENDTLSVAEINFGDNDTLSAIAAAMLSADYLFLMTDVDCLYTGNPRLDPHAKPIPVVTNFSELEADVSSAGSALGTGGMGTKIVAAKLATAAGVTTIITRSSQPGNVADIVAHLEASRRAADSEDAALPPMPAPLHTRFMPSTAPIRDRSFWLLHGLAPHGTLYIDRGAYRALRAKAGLLPVGVVAVEGNFAQQEAVRLVVVPDGVPSTPPVPLPLSAHGHSASNASALSALDALDLDLGASLTASRDGWSSPGSSTATTTAAPSRAELLEYPDGSAAAWREQGRDVGRALVNYAATEVARIRGRQSSEIAAVLGYADSAYVAVRENVSLFESAGDGDLEGAKVKEHEVPMRFVEMASLARYEQA